MDWSVILDGFVLLMQVAGAMFLVWGAWLCIQSKFDLGRKSPAQPVAYPEPHATESFQ